MTDFTRTQEREEFVGNALEAVIRIGVLLVLVGWCFDIMRPFVSIIVWGIVIAIGSHGLYDSINDKIGKRRNLSAVIFAVFMLAMLIIPVWALSGTMVEGGTNLAKAIESGAIKIPPPPPGVADWWFIGEPISKFWTLASQNLEAAIDKIGPQLTVISQWLLKATAGAGLGILMFIVAIIIAAVLHVNSASCHHAARLIFRRIAGDRGHEYADLSESTVRSVTKGILGVAFIQALMAGVGFLAVGIPAAGLLALVVLFLAVIQVGPGLVIIPTIIYVFTKDATLVAVIYAIWGVVTTVIDSFLKPIMLGRGVDVPMLVIFVGAIGGFITMGIIGLFVGAIILVLGYTLFMAWLREEDDQADDRETGEETTIA
jgi:predicted PurR-regulated permease PerM